MLCPSPFHHLQYSPLSFLWGLPLVEDAARAMPFLEECRSDSPRYISNILRSFITAMNPNVYTSFIVIMALTFFWNLEVSVRKALDTIRLLGMGDIHWQYKKFCCSNQQMTRRLSCEGFQTFVARIWILMFLIAVSPWQWSSKISLASLVDSQFFTRLNIVTSIDEKIALSALSLKVAASFSSLVHSLVGFLIEFPLSSVFVGWDSHVGYKTKFLDKLIWSSAYFYLSRKSSLDHLR